MTKLSFIGQFVSEIIHTNTLSEDIFAHSGESLQNPLSWCAGRRSDTLTVIDKDVIPNGLRSIEIFVVQAGGRKLN